MALGDEEDRGPFSDFLQNEQPDRQPGFVEYADASHEDTRSQQDRIAAGDSPWGSTQYNGTSGRIDVRPGVDVGALEREARAYAASKGVTYNQSDIEGYLRNTGYQTGGLSNEEARHNLFENYDQRASNTPGAAHQPNTPYVGPRTPWPTGPGGQTSSSSGGGSMPLSAAMSSLGPAPQPYIDGTARGQLYAQAFAMMQEGAKTQLGRYFTPLEVDSHLQRMGYRFDGDDKLPMHNVGSWISTVLPHEAEAVAYRSRQQSAAAPPSAPLAPPPGGTPGPGIASTEPGGPAANSSLIPRYTGPTYRGGAFDDPASNFAEQYALHRFGERTSPGADSGTGLYESFARRFAEMLQAPPFTSSQEAALKAKAFDQLEQSKMNELRTKAEELSRRRIPPSSGVYISEMNRIRDKWDRLKASNQNVLMTDAIGEHQRRLTQALQVLGSLAGSENQRLDAALALSMVPYNLQSAAYDRLANASGLGGAGGSGDLMQLLQLAMEQGRYDQQGQSASLGALMEVLGSLFGA